METHWQEYKARLKHYIAKQVNDQSVVEDILQDVYIKAHTQLHRLKSEESVGSWLYRIAHNTVVDHYRRQYPVEELPEFLEAPEEDEAEQVHQELAWCIKPMMDDLPEKYRVPLMMSELEGMSQKQVALELGLSLSGAKSRIQRGRVLLRERYTACCDIEVGRGGVVDYKPRASGNCQIDCLPDNDT
ncbi:RNA polymerase sigma factor SigZ [Endozoicomonas sp.]|uniref:RNA polymerase sigma factor SigZ n=1 Tax=Endozoicomonas sp. TaxID=1892382 RepID=UPI003AF5D01C